MLIDDTQLYSAFKSNEIDNAISDISSCTSDISNWRKQNKLKMNSDKTEIMLCGSTQKLKNIDIESVIIDDDSIEISDTIRDLGFFLIKI